MSGHGGSDVVAGEPSDRELIGMTARGDSSAYAELWSRHYMPGIRAAMSISSTLDPDDLVQEAFTRIYKSIKRGDGPKQSFRPYLYSAIRNTAATWGRKQGRELPHDGFENLSDPRFDEKVAELEADAALAVAAYRELPVRWQEVLWYLEVESLKPAEVAQLMGMSAHAVSQLGVRAREGLRDAWVSAHVMNPNLGEECLWVSQRLGKYSRSRSSERERCRIEDHLSDCERCGHAVSQLNGVVGQLKSSALVIVLGSSAATGILTMLGPSSASSPANAATLVMPESVVKSSLASSLSPATAGKATLVLAVAALSANLLLFTTPNSESKNVTSKPPLPKTASETVQDEPAAEDSGDSSTMQGPFTQPETTPEVELRPSLTAEEEPEPQQSQKLEQVPEPVALGVPAVWNTSRTADANSGYAVTVMLGGMDNAEVVALLNGSEVARSSGSSPQLMFNVTAEQFQSADLQFAYVVDGVQGSLTEPRTPAAWCGGVSG